MEDLIIFGLASFAVVVAIRVACQSAGILGIWLLLHKPVSCDLCLSFWASLALHLIGCTLPTEYGGYTALVAPVFAAAGVSVLALKLKEWIER